MCVCLGKTWSINYAHKNIALVKKNKEQQKTKVKKPHTKEKHKIKIFRNKTYLPIVF